MLTASGHVKLVDFGTCKDMLETDLNGGEFVGTAQYMSPQAVASEEQVGVVVCQAVEEDGGGGVSMSSVFMHGRSRMTIDPRNPYYAGTEHVGSRGGRKGAGGGGGHILGCFFFLLVFDMVIVLLFISLFEDVLAKQPAF